MVVVIGDFNVGIRGGLDSADGARGVVRGAIHLFEVLSVIFTQVLFPLNVGIQPFLWG